MSLARRWRKRLRALLRRGAVERELEEELAYHLERETRRNIEAGVSPEEARRRAALAFGGLERFREEVREARFLGRFTGLSLDMKLAARMLVKNPALTVIGGVGLAAAIGIGVVLASALSIARAPVPLPEGDRLVALEVRDLGSGGPERRLARDFGLWREGRRSVEGVSAFRTIRRNVAAEGVATTQVVAAELTASGFRLAGVPPLLGRPLVEADERAGAPDVVVLGHRVWTRSFGGDPSIVGRDVRIGDVVHTVVGVMPEGFLFPIHHDAWTPLRLSAAYGPGEGPAIQVFGRLVPGATPERASAELEALARRTEAAVPSEARLRPRVIPFTRQVWAGETLWMFGLLQAAAALLLLVVCVTVGVLVYARTATRRGEIVVRSALGASRRRIVGQLFAEALVLAMLAAVAGIAAAELGLRRVDDVLLPMGISIPFWMHLGVSPAAAVYGAGLAVLGAIIVGVVPGLRATGIALQTGLRRLSLGGTDMRLGRTWSGLIVMQVAFAVAALPMALFVGSIYVRYGFVDVGSEADGYLTARVELDAVPGHADGAGDAERASTARYRQRFAELVRRLETESAVASATWAVLDEPRLRVEVEGDIAAQGPPPSRPPADVSSGAGGAETTGIASVARVDAGFLEALAIPLLAGRALTPADAGSEAVVVTRAFADRFLGGLGGVGSRFRYSAATGGAVEGGAGIAPEGSYRVVGVAADYPARALQPGDPRPKVYHVLDPGEARPATLVLGIHGGSPASFAGRLRDVAAAVDPAFRLADVRTLRDFLERLQPMLRIGAVAVAVLTLSVLALSAAALYALMSFTVAQRRREIGIRTALGAHPGRLLASIFSRAVAQLAAGIAAGLGLAALLDTALNGQLTGGSAALLLPLVALVMLVVGALAAVQPAWRGLRVQPMDALREE